MDTSEIYLTNGIGEDTGNIAPITLDRCGLRWDEDQFPLTALEANYTDEIMIIEGYEWYGCYTTLIADQKYHCPTFEIPYSDSFWGDSADSYPTEDEAIDEAKIIKRSVEGWAKERGGVVLTEEDMPGRINLRIRYPFENVVGEVAEA